MYKVLDIKKWKRYKQYKWFSSFVNPCYGIDATIDVTDVVNYSKTTNTSFFINFLYVVSKAMNEVEEMRLRVVNNKVLLYDVIHPTYTIAIDSGTFENGGHEMSFDYPTFYERASKEIESKKHKMTTVDTYNSDSYDCLYITCLPWLDFKSFSHPIPSGNVESLSVPRICWSKFTLQDNLYVLTLNITVSHALVDGEPLCRCFNIIRENCKFFKK